VDERYLILANLTVFNKIYDYVIQSVRPFPGPEKMRVWKLPQLESYYIYPYLALNVDDDP